MNEHWQENMARRIGSGIIWLQRLWARSVWRLLACVPPHWRRWLVLSWGLAGAIWCICLVAQGIWGQPTAISLPGSLVLPHVEQRGPSPSSEQSLIKFLDSLKVHAPDQWDTLLRRRPGLADSIRIMREMIK